MALSLSDIPMILAFGLLSDYIGRRKMFLTGMAGLAFFAVPYFMLVSTSNIWLFMLGSLIVQACRCAVYGPQSAYFAEQFSTRMRYSGCSLAYQFAAIIGAWRRWYAPRSSPSWAICTRSPRSSSSSPWYRSPAPTS